MGWRAWVNFIWSSPDFMFEMVTFLLEEEWRTVSYLDWLEGFTPSDAGIINAIAGVIILDSSLTEAIYIRWLERKRERSCYNWKRIVMRPSGRNASASGPKSMTSSIPYMTLPPTKGYPAPLRGNPCIQKKIGNNFNQRFEQWNAITLYRVVNIFQGNVKWLLRFEWGICINEIFWTINNVCEKNVDIYATMT